MKLEFSKDKHQEFINLMNIKNTQNNIQKEYYKKTNKYIKFIKWIPWIQMIWIWNSLSMNSANINSDIDLLIVTSPNRMWITRIFSTIIFQILFVRKTSKKHAWKFCLSFFCTTNWLNFWDFAIKNDIYLYFWIIYFKPILDYNNTYNNFIETNQKWANFNNYLDIIENNKTYIKYSKITNKSSNFKIKILDLLDYLLKKLFLWKTLKSYEKLAKPYWVIINDNVLKFHNNDKRKEIKKLLNL